MPNHVHGILIITDKSVETRLGSSKPVETCRGMSLRKERINIFSKPIAGSISMVVNHYKGAVTKWCRSNNINNFSWQDRFYDRVIRNDRELDKIREYIKNNPLKWDLDRNNPSNR